MPRINDYTLRDNTELTDADNFAVDTPAGVYRTRFQDVRDRVVSDTTVGQFSPDWLSTASNATLSATQIGASITTGGVTVTIPDGLDIGTEREIHKANSGAVDSIALSGAESGPATLTLTSEGDYWRLRKVTATSWALIGGFESGSDANGSWTRYYNGLLEQTHAVVHGAISSSAWGAGFISSQLTWTFPVSFNTAPIFLAKVIQSGNRAFAGSTGNITTTTQAFYELHTFVQPTEGAIDLYANGRWY